MSSRNLKDLDPHLRELCNYFLVQCMSEGIHAFVTCTYRSHEEQDAEYAKGRTAPGPVVTNAKGGQSPHEWTHSDGNPSARAFDFAIKTNEGSLDWNASDGQWQRAIHIGESLGLISGETFPKKDYAHFQLKDWKV